MAPSYQGVGGGFYTRRRFETVASSYDQTYIASLLGKTFSTSSTSYFVDHTSRRSVAYITSCNIFSNFPNFSSFSLLVSRFLFSFFQRICSGYKNKKTKSKAMPSIGFFCCVLKGSSCTAQSVSTKKSLSKKGTELRFYATRRADHCHIPSHPIPSLYLHGWAVASFPTDLLHRTSGPACPKPSPAA